MRLTAIIFILLFIAIQLVRIENLAQEAKPLIEQEKERNKYVVFDWDKNKGYTQENIDTMSYIQGIWYGNSNLPKHNIEKEKLPGGVNYIEPKKKQKEPIEVYTVN